MNEHQVTVSLNGRFVFRTDWENDQSRLDQVIDLITEAFPHEKGFRTQLRSRSLCSTLTELDNGQPGVITTANAIKEG
jgi:hypothetical protein